MESIQYIISTHLFYHPVELPKIAQNLYTGNTEQTQIQNQFTDAHVNPSHYLDQKELNVATHALNLQSAILSPIWSTGRMNGKYRME